MHSKEYKNDTVLVTEGVVTNEHISKLIIEITSSYHATYNIKSLPMQNLNYVMIRKNLVLHTIKFSTGY